MDWDKVDQRSWAMYDAAERRALARGWLDCFEPNCYGTAHDRANCWPNCCGCYWCNLPWPQWSPMCVELGCPSASDASSCLVTSVCANVTVCLLTYKEAHHRVDGVGDRDDEVDEYKFQFQFANSQWPDKWTKSLKLTMTKWHKQFICVYVLSVFASRCKLRQQLIKPK